MCGICGLISLAGTPLPEARVLAAMAGTLRHRGPDDEGLHLDAHAALANRRLSIVDLPGGHQPMYNEDRSVCVVFNGEIYNQADLRRELEAAGHAFATRSDTEVLVHLYEEHGEGMVERLNGMFAFAVWDTRSLTALLARDRLGVKPLYLLQRPGQVAFASEIKALLALPDVEMRLDAEALDLYLSLRYVPAERSIFQGISKLLPGYLLRIEARTGRCRSRPYWHPESLPQRHDLPSEGDLAAELRELLQDAVRIRLMSDVPFGAFLSGGLDSSGIVALMSGLLDEPVRTFAIGFSEEGRLDEREHARAVATTFATAHREVDCTASQVESLPLLLHHFDEPFSDPIIVPTFQVCQLAAEHVKVVLTGEGADEVFGGYTRFAADGGVRRLVRLPGWSRRAAVGLLQGMSLGQRGEQARRALELAGMADGPRFAAWVTAFSPEEKARLLVPELGSGGADRAAALYSACAAEVHGQSTTNRMLYCDLRLRLPECMLARTDRMTMAVSLEGRTPFLDYRLVEWALRLPEGLKVRRGQEKHILRQALSPLLPRRITARRKQGLAVPFAQWTRYGIEAHIRRILSPRAVARRGYFRPQAVQDLLSRWGPHAARHSQLIWSLLCLEVWCRLYVDRDLDPRTPVSEVGR
ncbi:MAG: asparagine synthase (glutamine-hydrolyzing) [Candidatus Latescibacterota bacterium]